MKEKYIVQAQLEENGQDYYIVYLKNLIFGARECHFANVKDCFVSIENLSQIIDHIVKNGFININVRRIE